MVLSIEKRVFVVEYLFREGNRYTDLVQEQFAEQFPEIPVPHRNVVRRIIEKCRETLDAERSGRPSKLLTLCCGVHQNHCASWRSWTSLPTYFRIAQRLSNRRYAESVCE
jgi:hypothetical protein